jgi:uncharacterized Zn finger protein
MAQIEPAIRSSDNHAYAGAIAWLEKARTLFARLEQEHAFDELVREIRERHRAKRNLIKTASATAARSSVSRRS